MANIITGTRILISFFLLFCAPLSPAFYILYIAAGISDMIDGAIARKTNTVSEFGSKLDTFADLVFVSVCLIKLLPVTDIPLWICLWIAGIAVIKLMTIVLGYIRQKKFIVVHSLLNRVTGGLLFLFPFTLSFIDLKYSAPVLCLIASAAAVREGYETAGPEQPQHLQEGQE